MTCAFLVAVAACSRSDHKATAVKRAPFNCTTTTALGGSTPTSLTPDCQATEFLNQVRAEKNPALAKLSDEQLVAFTRSLCAFGAPDSNTTTSQPIYADLLTSTAASWGVSVDVVDALAKATNAMCPDTFRWLGGLPRSRGSLQVDLAVTGSGPASISFNVPDGSTLTDRVNGPWQQVLHLRQAQRVTLQVQPTDGSKVGCRVSIGGTVLSQADPSTGQTICDVAPDDIDRGSAKR